MADGTQLSVPWALNPPKTAKRWMGQLVDLAMYFGPPGSAARISKGKLEEMLGPPPPSTSSAFPFLPCFKEKEGRV